LALVSIDSIVVELGGQPASAREAAGHLQDRARLLVSCPDQPGIVASVSTFLFESGANIVQSAQHTTDPWGGSFFMRVEFDLPSLEQRKREFKEGFSKLAKHFQMNWELSMAARRKRIAIFASKQEHCLLELLWQWRSGDLDADVALVVSNHLDLADTVAAWGVPFHHIPVKPETKPQAEEAELKLLRGHVDLLVLARYMQILSPRFLREWGKPIINIHHGFLPAFAGGRAYEQAFERGVKLIGATAHYVSEELDAGPIIEQDVQRVGHGQTVDDLKRLGRYIERQVLARAVSWHVQDRVLLHENKTIVF
jgi:formyltetrahydrofolate deformylase